MSLAAALARYDATRERALADLKAVVRIPSVSDDPRRRGDVRRCAEWLAGALEDAGLESTRLVETSGHPVVAASWRRRRDRPTVLVYGHYDVQPAEPSEWRTPPFEPTLRADSLYGRGASDDKGQVIAHVRALDAWLRGSGSLPVNVVCVFEGAEEIGSPGLYESLVSMPEVGACDAAVVSDTAMLGPNRPAITYALRGGFGVEIEVRGPDRHLHGGRFGGAICEPAFVLCRLLAGLHDARGRVAVPGFYDKVMPFDAGERARLRAQGPSERLVLDEAGVTVGCGEAGYSPYERIAIRPAAVVTSLSAGPSGPGAQSLIPASARVRVAFRLVPEQDPAEVASAVSAHLRAQSPPGVQLDVRVRGGGPAIVLDRSQPVTVAAARAYRAAFGVAPAFIRSGGSVPVTHLLAHRLGLPTVLMGFALPGDGWHAPDERQHLPTFARAIETSIRFFDELPRAGLRMRARHRPARARS
jgi:acetylornithine deacetylase/succinyl-diaminopimelate desuccinylase-like protein